MKIHKREASVRGKNRGFKSSMTVYAGLITYLISLLIRIPLAGVIGDAGMGLAAPALELTALITIVFTYGISRTMTGLIRYRLKREQYRNARKIFHTAFKIAVAIAVIFAAVLILGVDYIAEIAVLETMCKKAVLAAAPVAVLAALISVFRGYFNGNGFGVLVAQSQYLEKIAMFICMLTGGRLVYEYGEKAAALLHHQMVAYAYGALGVILGIMIAQIITLIYLLFMFAVYAGTWKRQILQDAGRRVESGGEAAGLLLGNGFPVVFIVVLCNAFMLIDQRFFNYCMNVTEQGEVRTALWGAYYGKFAALVGIGSVLVCLAVHSHIGKIAMAYEKEEYRLMRDRIGNAVKKLCITAFPIAIYMAVLAEALVKSFFKGENALAISLLRQGTVMIVFYALAYLFGQIMLKIRMTKELLLSVAAAFVIHLAALYFLVRKALLGGAGVVYSVIIFTAVLAIMCFVLTSRKVKYRQEWVASVAFPAISACVAGLVAMLLNKLLFSMVGGLMTVVISCLISTILYIIMLIVLRVVNEGELSRMPLGNIWITLGRMIGVL